MNYYNKRIKALAHKAYSRIPLFGMLLRIIILLALLIGGKVACEWSVDQSINHVESWERR